MNIVTEKKCSKCGEVKNISCFIKDSTKKDGLYPSCKDCYKKDYESKSEYHKKRCKDYRINNREVVLTKKRESWHKNRDKNLEALAKYHAENKDKEKEYRSKNKEKISASGKAWYENNKQWVRENLRIWRKNNPEKVFIQKANRHTLERGGSGAIKYEDWKDLLDRYGNKCLCCGRTDVKLTQDHIMPLSLGGLHSIENIQPLCRSCNSRKSAKFIDYRK